MLWRAIIAFLALPGVVAFAIPLAIGLNQPRLIPLRLLGWPILVAGVSILVWCVMEFYVAGRGTLAPLAPPETSRFLGSVQILPQSHVRWRRAHLDQLGRSLFIFDFDRLCSDSSVSFLHQGHCRRGTLVGANVRCGLAVIPRTSPTLAVLTDLGSTPAVA